MRHAVLDMADEHREAVLRVLDHVGPRGIAAGELGPSRPAQRREHRRRDRLHRDAAVDIVLHEIFGFLDGEDRAQHLVWAVGGEALELGLPGVEVQVLELAVRVVLRHVHRLRDAGFDVRRDRRDHLLVRVRRELERGDEVGWQICHVAAHRAVAAPGVVLDRELLQRAIGHALLPGIRPGKRRLDAVRCVIGEREADRPRGRDREQMRIAQPVLLDLLLDRRRQARGEAGAGEIEIGVEQRERTALPRQFD